MLDGSFVMSKAGPLPVWAWMGLGLGGALALSAWKSNKANPKGGANTGTDILDQYAYPSNLPPQFAFVDADTTLVTNTYAPPGGGRPPDVTPVPPVPTPAPAPSPTPKPVPAPAPHPTPAPSGSWVWIVKKAGATPPWNSTVAGIAGRYYGNANLWGKIWNAPQNTALRQARKHDPSTIRPGDKLWVPK